MINIRKEQKIKIPDIYQEFLNPDYIFLPINNQETYYKKSVLKGQVISSKKISVSGNILISTINGQDKYLIIQNDKLEKEITNNKDNLSDSKEKKDNKKNLDSKIIDKIRNKEVLYINALDKDPICFNNYYILDKEKSNILECLQYLITNNYIKKVKIIIPATYVKEITAYQKLKNKDIGVIIVNDYFSLGYSTILSKYLRIKRDDLISLEDLITLSYEVNKKISDYVYLTISGNLKNMVLKVKKYTILNDILNYLQIDRERVEINLNNSLVINLIDYKYVIDENTKLIILTKKEEVKKEENPKDICINCGLCYNVCPWHINPLENSKCYNCGLCNYVCPSKKELRVGNEL